ncbi:hypothetical protein LX99_01937 [Mucilaginibacter oryzae]|uniref:Uncharacterized protein n=1 Tax=Mucilaginibacter oryzae TaxID=468058 RepID=A0A316HCF1_9SPHI|nr:hypothetical protein [Mucilaginibacter oryzae]PWK78097.1 hypothetical protein LX99_01937 [Mucilaginibacter oryzae]
MDEHNLNPQAAGSPAPGNTPFGGHNKKPNNMKIVGYNLLVLIAYTIICRFNLNDGAILDMFFIGIHVSAGIILAIVNRSWAWLLSALMVLVIGFSTCIGMVNISGH